MKQLIILNLNLYQNLRGNFLPGLLSVLYQWLDQLLCTKRDPLLGLVQWPRFVLRNTSILNSNMTWKIRMFQVKLLNISFYHRPSTVWQLPVGFPPIPWDTWVNLYQSSHSGPWIQKKSLTVQWSWWSWLQWWKFQWVSFQCLAHQKLQGLPACNSAYTLVEPVSNNAVNWHMHEPCSLQIVKPSLIKNCSQRHIKSDFFALY